MNLERDVRALKVKLNNIANGTDPELKRKLNDLEWEKKEQLRRSKTFRQFQMDSIKHLHQFEIKAADDLLEQRKENLVNKITESTSKKLKRLENQRNGITKNPPTRRSMRGRHREDGSRRKHDNSKNPLTVSLSESEIMEDISAIYNDWTNKSKRIVEKKGGEFFLLIHNQQIV
eukprot:TRINITY_DN2523_c0_g1_i2.p1 TRINITY_DN2523_c0_g1~~TRINITY_DN2523_c0_g1_i2.p1  ORF type:complete len:174 (+),score=35.88 TRINITY_DN2523_c0_g1_i2:123-644(+)